MFNEVIIERFFKTKGYILNWNLFKYCPYCPKFEKWFEREIKTCIYGIIRCALTGSQHGANIVDTITMLGKNETCQRINNYIEYIKNESN